MVNPSLYDEYTLQYGGSIGELKHLVQNINKAVLVDRVESLKPAVEVKVHESIVGVAKDGLSFSHVSKAKTAVKNIVLLNL